MMVGERKYETEQTLPEFAEKHLRNCRVSFVLTDPVQTGRVFLQRGLSLYFLKQLAEQNPELAQATRMVQRLTHIPEENWQTVGDEETKDKFASLSNTELMVRFAVAQHATSIVGKNRDRIELKNRVSIAK